MTLSARGPASDSHFMATCAQYTSREAAMVSLTASFLKSWKYLPLESFLKTVVSRVPGAEHTDEIVLIVTRW